MQSSIAFLTLLFALIAIHSDAFAPPLQSTTSLKTSTAIYGKRERAVNKVKKMFGVEAETKSKVKLSDGKAKGLARKYQNIDCLEEKSYEVLKDLKMVGSH